MQNPKKINIADYHYDLPNHRIAKFPLNQRDKSKLLITQGGRISESRFNHISDHLPHDSLLIFNNTKVIQARLLFSKATGASIEIFCLEPSKPQNHEKAFASQGSCTWLCMVKNLKKWKQGALQLHFDIAGNTHILTASYLYKEGKEHLIQFDWTGACNFAELLDYCGVIPIPPYLYRESENSDKHNYQTVYAKHKGSVAAPTAGLHFSPEVLTTLEKKGIQKAELTLHVGAGTFQAVKGEQVGQHQMHKEQVLIDLSLIDKLLEHQGTIISVGTTSTRSLESIYWLGYKLLQEPFLGRAEQLQVDQWSPYEAQAPLPSTPEALQAVKTYMQSQALSQLSFSTEIIIAPGYTFKVIHGLITNFHQPQSTLLLLISAFLKTPSWKEVYNFALQHNYRFLSYGDSCLFL